ncbi:receptor-like protein EIX2 [Ziziphus jujuba]|uniref:Receptor-like protein EIX2 n=1 Tax=Ziziphus jujuba TaxID=326968 RepID=A0A6P4BNW2_ZIZJJ|nr:receptor-like protein EIX2 [Ziziphus jujuba]
MGQVMAKSEVLDLSGNLLNGSIPPSINRLKDLTDLDLSNNSLSGEIHNHWTGMRISTIDLSRNNLSGRIPNELCSLPSLVSLRLSRNYLSGKLPLSLQNCSMIISTLDLGYNKFSGTIPIWIGQRFPVMLQLRLRHNYLTGNIPQQLCQLTYVHILDLAENKLSGPIPTCLDRMIGFKVPGFYFKLVTLPLMGHHFSYPTYMDLVMKGRQDDYDKSQTEIVKVLDLSRNNLSGNIPAAATNLSELVTLSLSCNRSNSHKHDFSDFVEPLNLSNNNLSGPIPLANQFQTFNDPSIFGGNPGLCGSPLPTKCSSNSVPKDRGTTEDDEDGSLSDNFWFYVSMGLGFIFGFWAVCGSLAIKRSWRRSYFEFLDKTKDRILLVLALNAARLQRMMKKMEDN